MEHQVRQDLVELLVIVEPQVRLVLELLVLQVPVGLAEPQVRVDSQVHLVFQVRQEPADIQVQAEHLEQVFQEQVERLATQVPQEQAATVAQVEHQGTLVRQDKQVLMD